MRSKSSLLRFLGASGVTVFSLACGASRMSELANRGDRQALLLELKGERPVSRADARGVAHATLEFEIGQAKGVPGIDWLSSLSPCSGAMKSALSDRADAGGPVGARAALLLAELGNEPSTRNDDENSQDPGRRALFALAQDDEDGAELRRKFMLDPDPLVRRAAMQAAMRAESPDDAPLLLEASRLDPDELVRSRALSALGRIGGADNVSRLYDRFETLGQSERLVITEAWASPASLDAGGRGHLERLVGDSSRGLERVLAASLLYQVERNPYFLGRLGDFIRHGTTDEKRLAIQLLPDDGSIGLTFLDEASTSDDPDVSGVALIRLYILHRARDQKRFLEIEKRLVDRVAAFDSDPQAKAKSLGMQAASTLAAFGSPRVHLFLTKSASSPLPARRAIAARGLLRLEDYRGVTRLMADPELSVRTEAACLSLAPVPASL